MRRKGIALASVIVITVVLLMIAVFLVTISTSQARYSLKKYNEALTRQTAIAGMSEVLYILGNNKTWNASLFTSGTQNDEKYMPENKCHYKIDVNECSQYQCEIIVSAYIKNGSRRTGEKKIKAIFRKSPFEYASLGGFLGEDDDQPGVIVENNSTIFGDVGSFKAPDTVSIAIGMPPPPINLIRWRHIELASRGNDHQPGGPSGAGNQMTGTQISQPSGNSQPAGVSGGEALGGSGSLSEWEPNKPHGDIHALPTYTGSGNVPDDPPANDPNPNSENPVTSGNQGGTTNPNNNPGDASPHNTSQPTVPGGENPSFTNLGGWGNQGTLADCSKITGNIFVRKNAKIVGNYNESQKQIVNDAELKTPTYPEAAAGDYKDIVIPEDKTLKFKTGVYTISKFNAESCNIKVDAAKGPVYIFVKDEISIKNCTFNSGGNPADVYIYGLYDEKKVKACDLEINGNSSCSFLFIGKKAMVSVKDSSFSGSLIARQVKINNSIVAFPDGLRKLTAMPIVISMEEI